MALELKIEMENMNLRDYDGSLERLDGELYIYFQFPPAGSIRYLFRENKTCWQGKPGWEVI
jgi:hypothetical protein